jgi:murein DD-endopeptidase MepM/ murein hydrolase activator NlpD
MAAVAWRFPTAFAMALPRGGALVSRPAKPVTAVRDAQPTIKIRHDTRAVSLQADTPPVLRGVPERVDGPTDPSSDVYPASAVQADPIADLRERHLEVPVQGARRDKLVDSFDDARGTSSPHEAIDILAPRNTPVVAVEDGIIAKLFLSVPGGITVYQFDPTTRYEYYYAHLERYADGLAEGAHVSRAQIIGYVGTSGNAPKDTPHLHFAISILTGQRQWWHSTPIDPYLVLK